MAPPTRGAQAEAALATAGLRRISGRPGGYPLGLVIFDPAEEPQQTITCVQRDSQCNCTQWKICGTTNGETYRCYDLMKDPAFSWIVTW